MARLPADYRLVWGDLHIHSYFSSCYWGEETLPDGFDGSPADCYRYARDVAGMDFGAVTDHTWSGNGRMLVEDEWAEILDANRQYHEPDRFVSIPAYEWNAPKDRQWGHRNTLFNHDEPPILRSGSEVTELSQLWQQLAELPYASLSIPHHLARDATPYDWSQHSADWEPVVEITSLWGNYEYQGNPHECDPNWSPSATGSFLQDGLAKANRVGVIGGGDNHTGHAGGHYFNTQQAKCGELPAPQPPKPIPNERPGHGYRRTVCHRIHAGGYLRGAARPALRCGFRSQDRALDGDQRPADGRGRACARR